jgi:uncharacterized protein with HEPN domain
MRKEYRVFLEDMLECVELIERYVKDMEEEDFYADPQVQDAVLRRLEIIGEAAKRIPETVRQKHPRIPWRKVAGLRDVIIHGYAGVNMKRVWTVIIENLPELKEELSAIKIG